MPGTLVEEKGNGTLEIFALPTSTDFLTRLLTDIFNNHWQEIQFGILIQGAVFEIKADRPPEKIDYLDGYLTVDFGSWHLHLCIGEHKGSRNEPCDPELAAHRRTARAELFRRLNRDGSVGSWGLRLFNGKDENQLHVFLPNPFLSAEMKFVRTPDWSRLALWDKLRQNYAGLEPDATDRSGKTMYHR